MVGIAGKMSGGLGLRPSATSVTVIALTSSTMHLIAILAGATWVEAAYQRAGFSLLTTNPTATHRVISKTISQHSHPQYKSAYGRILGFARCGLLARRDRVSHSDVIAPLCHAPRFVMRPALSCAPLCHAPRFVMRPSLFCL